MLQYEKQRLTSHYQCLKKIQSRGDGGSYNKVLLYHFPIIHEEGGREREEEGERQGQRKRQRAIP